MNVFCTKYSLLLMVAKRWILMLLNAQQLLPFVVILEEFCSELFCSVMPQAGYQHSTGPLR